MAGRNNPRRQRNLKGKFSNTKNVGPAKTVRGTTPGGQGSVRGRGPVINGDPKLTGPKQQLRLEAPRPMKDITPRSVGQPRGPQKLLPSPPSTAKVVGGASRALSGAVGAAAAVALSPTPVGMGERRNNEQAVGSQREADLMTTRTGASLSKGPSTRGKAGPSTRYNTGGSAPMSTRTEENLPSATKEAHNIPVADTSKPMVKSASTSGTTQVSTSTSSAAKEAHNIPVAESRAMKGAIAGMSENIKKKQATSTGYKDPYANTRLKPRMRGNSDR